MSFAVGDLVKHAKLGTGEVLAVFPGEYEIRFHRTPDRVRRIDAAYPLEGAAADLDTPLAPDEPLPFRPTVRGRRSPPGTSSS